MKMMEVRFWPYKYSYQSCMATATKNTVGNAGKNITELSIAQPKGAEQIILLVEFVTNPAVAS
jgi:hypothetical protein